MGLLRVQYTGGLHLSVLSTSGLYWDNLTKIQLRAKTHSKLDCELGGMAETALR